MSIPKYPVYKESAVSWLGPVPSHWEVLRLKHACEVFPSNVDKHARDDEPPVLLCNYTDVYYNEQITADMPFMAATASAEQIARFTLKGGDTIITKDSETADDIAIAAYVPEDLPGVVCGYHLSMVRPRASTWGAYVKRLFDSFYAKARFAVAANGLTRVGLGQYALDNVELPFPPPEEQRVIATFLDGETAKIDTLVEEQRRLIELLKEKRQAVISQAVSKGSNPNVPMKDSGVEWLGKVPQAWTVRSLRTLSSVVRGASPRPAGDPQFFNGDHIPWVTVAEITKDALTNLMETETCLTEAGAEHSRLLRSGTVIYSNSGATLGVPKILRVDACANDGVVGFESLSDLVEPTFLYHYLSSLTTTIRDMVRQGSGQPNLNTSLVKAIPIALPSRQEQLAICSNIEEVTMQFDRLSTEAEEAMTLLQERRSALISAAVTGKIDVRGLAPQPEAVVA